MSPAATVATVVVTLAAALSLGLFLAVWPPMWTACVLTAALVTDETRRCWRRWRAVRKWAARLSK